MTVWKIVVFVIIAVIVVYLAALRLDGGVTARHPISDIVRVVMLTVTMIVGDYWLARWRKQARR